MAKGNFRRRFCPGEVSASIPERLSAGRHRDADHGMGMRLGHEQHRLDSEAVKKRH
jgi:hypothetical protein